MSAPQYGSRQSPNQSWLCAARQGADPGNQNQNHPERVRAPRIPHARPSGVGERKPHPPTAKRPLADAGGRPYARDWAAHLQDRHRHAVVLRAAARVGALEHARVAGELSSCGFRNFHKASAGLLYDCADLAVSSAEVAVALSGPAGKRCRFRRAD